MQAAMGKHVLVVDPEPADRQLNAVSDAFSTRLLSGGRAWSLAGK
jgi:hypothetical protein